MTDEPDNIAPAEDVKAKLEIEKLEMEIRALRSWWKRALMQPTTLVAIIAAVGTIAVGFLTGFFNVQKETAALKLERAAFELQQLQAGRTQLHGDIAALRSEKERLEAERQTLRGQVATARQAAVAARAERDSLQRQSQELQANIARWHERVRAAGKRVQGMSGEIITGIFQHQPIVHSSQLSHYRH